MVSAILLRRFMMRYRATIAYMLAIVLINFIFAYSPRIHMFGQAVSPADALVGIVYVLRDFSQRELGHRVLWAMAAAIFLSYWVSSPAIAWASVSGLLVGETLDWIVFTLTKRPLSQRLLLSSLLSAPLDTVVFLAVAHQLTFMQALMMTLGKFVGVFSIWLIWRAQHRTPSLLVVG